MSLSGYLPVLDVRWKILVWPIAIHWQKELQLLLKMHGHCYQRCDVLLVIAIFVAVVYGHLVFFIKKLGVGVSNIPVHLIFINWS